MKAPAPAARGLLVRALRDAASTATLGMPAWDLLIRQARRADLLATLALRLRGAGLLGQVPPAPAAHLEAAEVLAAKQARDVRNEVRCIERVLGSMWIPVVLLKGAAYLLGDVSAGRGRLLGDVDIMVPRGLVADVERRLMDAGWVGFRNHPYDQRYFRVWMHEIPPLVHIDRGVTLDVHHTILPPTARLSPDADKLLAQAQALDDNGVVHVLHPLDMVLHSATHLFHEGEFEHGLRDLLDLDTLLREFTATVPRFWPALLARAAEMDLGIPLAYALRYTHAVWATPIPVDVLEESLRAARIPSGRLLVMDALYGRALAAPHRSCDVPGSGVARWLLYVRSHWIRMPPQLLVPHLLRKAVRRRLYEE